MAKAQSNTVKKPELIENELPMLHDEKNILNSKRFMRRQLEFKAPSETLGECIEILKPLNAVIKVDGSNEIKNGNTDESLNIAYGRTLVTATVKLDEDISYRIGVMFALDTAVPKIKMFTGANVNACLNDCIFGESNIKVLNAAQATAAEDLKKFCERFTKDIEIAKETIAVLKSIVINENELKTIIGNLFIKSCTTKNNRGIGNNAISNAVELLYNKEGKYYHKKEGFNKWMVYNSLTEYLAPNVNFFDIPERALDAYQLITDL